MSFLASLSASSSASSGGVYQAWLPRSASPLNAGTDHLFIALLLLSAAVLLLLVGLLDWLLWRYRSDGTDREGKDTPVSRLALAAAVGLPLIVVVLVFLGGMDGFVDREVAPARALEIRAVADTWHWSFHYPGDVEDAQLHLPLNRPVKLLLDSPHSIQGLYLPVFRAQQSAVPGREASLWFVADRPGEYEAVGTQVLGALEDSMRTKLIVHEQGGYEAWVATASDVLKLLPPVEAGKVLVERNGCLVCHTTDGTPKTGPSFKGVIGRHREFEDGSSMVTNEDYVRESIRQPRKRVVKGFQPLMPSFEGKVSDAEIDAIIEYFKSLGSSQGGS